MTFLRGKGNEKQNTHKKTIPAQQNLLKKNCAIGAMVTEIVQVLATIDYFLGT